MRTMEQKPKILNVRISPELHEALEEYRWSHRLSQSAAIRFLLRIGLNEQPDPNAYRGAHQEYEDD